VVAVRIIVFWRAMLPTPAGRTTCCYETSLSIYQTKRRLISEDSTQYRLRLCENRVQSGILRRRSNDIVVVWRTLIVSTAYKTYRWPN